MASVAAVVTALASSATGYIISHKIEPGKTAPNRVIFSVVSMEILLGVLLGIVALLLWPLLVGITSLPEEGMRGAYTAILLSVPLGAIWTTGSQIAIFDGRAGLYATTLIGQGVLQLIVTLLFLYGLGMHIGSLVAGQIAGSVVASVGGIVALRKHYSPGFDTRIFTSSMTLLPWAVVSALASSAWEFVERITLGRCADLHQVGLYVHAQSYRSLMQSSGKAVQNVLMPIMMREAHAKSTGFAKTRAGWDFVFCVFTAAGWFFALIGKEVVGLLTHGKFIEAAIYLPFLCCILLLQYLGRADVAMMYATGQGNALSRVTLASNLAGMGIMLVLTAWFGIFGLILAAALREVTYRTLIRVWSWKRYGNSFHDGLAIIGMTSILMVIGVSSVLHLALTSRVIILVVMLLGLAGYTWPLFTRFLRQAAEVATA
jgi:O-antigen/teichoic acid export membrane protein